MMEHMSDYANSRTLIYAGTEMKPGSAHETLQIQNHEVVGKT